MGKKFSFIYMTMHISRFFQKFGINGTIVAIVAPKTNDSETLAQLHRNRKGQRCFILASPTLQLVVPMI